MEVEEVKHKEVGVVIIPIKEDHRRQGHHQKNKDVKKKLIDSESEVRK